MTTRPTLSEPGLDRFNALSDDEAHEALLACCASPAFASRVAAGRPYRSAAELLDAAETACRGLGTDEVDEALAAHPRIGDRAEGGSTEARWSRQEQSSVSDADSAVRSELHDGNVAYEQRFGRVFLIRAAGRSPTEMLAELRRRLGNDAETERGETAEQLAQITRLRVERLLAA
jgi:2-oxo-4-hydroxy-4-carboxy-5-ureidoimidazoline decarboxylase